MSAAQAAATLSFNGQVAVLPVPVIAALHGKNAQKIAARFSRAVTENLAKWGLAAGTATVTMPDGTAIYLPIEWHAADNGDFNNGYPGRWSVGGGVGQFNATLQKSGFCSQQSQPPRLTPPPRQALERGLLFIAAVMKFDPATAKPGDVYKSPNYLPGDTVYVYINKRNCIGVNPLVLIPSRSQPPAWYVYSHNAFSQLVDVCSNPLKPSCETPEPTP